VRKHNRDRMGLLLQCRGDGPRLSENHLRLQGDQFFGESLHLNASRRIPMINVNITALRPPKPFQFFVEHLYVRIIKGEEHADTPDAVRLLRARHDRTRQRCAAEQRDERAASHHSITSSAMVSSPGGTSMPSARAV